MSGTTFTSSASTHGRQFSQREYRRLIAYSGVGFTTPYLCPSTITEFGELNTDDGLKTNLKSFETQSKKCADPLYKSDLVGTSFVARDIKAIAEALGEDGLIRFWGFSYGTVLGATLAAMFPDKVDRFTLDGNVSPIDYYYGM